MDINVDSVNRSIDIIKDAIAGDSVKNVIVLDKGQDAFNRAMSIIPASVRSKELEMRLQYIVKDVDIKVCIYKSPIPNAFTIPLANFSSEDLGLIRDARPGAALAMIKANIGALFDGMTKSYTPEFSDGHATIPGLTECTVFVADSLLSKLSEDETVAILLHEVGHNAAGFANILSSIAFPLRLIMAVIVASASAAFMAKYYWRKGMPPAVAKLLGSFVGIQTAQMFVMMFASIMGGRWSERRADNFSIKVGYGQHLASALDKLEKEINKPAEGLLGAITTPIRKFNMMVIKTLQALGLESHPLTTSRIRRARNTPPAESVMPVSEANLEHFMSGYSRAFYEADIFLSKLVSFVIKNVR